jgi:hypothetical protein
MRDGETVVVTGQLALAPGAKVDAKPADEGHAGGEPPHGALGKA